MLLCVWNYEIEDVGVVQGTMLLARFTRMLATTMIHNIAFLILLHQHNKHMSLRRRISTVSLKVARGTGHSFISCFNKACPRFAWASPLSAGGKAPTFQPYNTAAPYETDTGSHKHMQASFKKFRCMFQVYWLFFV